MPTYEYRCVQCAHTFEDFLSIADRDVPRGTPCPSCGKRGVERAVSLPVTGADATVGPGADFMELTRKMSRRLPKSAQENLSRAAGLRGRKYGAQ